jgi:hypothetical protein
MKKQTSGCTVLCKPCSPMKSPRTSSGPSTSRPISTLPNWKLLPPNMLSVVSATMGCDKRSRPCPQNVRRIRGSFGLNWADFAPFGRVQPLFFNDLGGKHLAPKAEVTGSNPVGCANHFKYLGDIFASQKVPCPENVRRICSLEVPGRGVHRIENACRMHIRLFGPFLNRHNVHYRDGTVLPDANQ